MSKRTVILFGAGAVKDWHAPTTETITKAVLGWGFYCDDNTTTITQYIFDKLVESGHYVKDLNFETIINVIEDLIVYYSYFDKEKRTTSLLKAFFNSKFEEKILNYSIAGGVERHGFKLEIPKGQTYNYNPPLGAVNNETPQQYFLQLLLVDLLTDISAKFFGRDGYIKENQGTNKENEKLLNNGFLQWINKVVGNNDILRMYTLNYDSLFKDILEQKGWEIFDGFSAHQTNHSGGLIPANVIKIVNDFNCSCYYNMHGSVFWEVESRDQNELLDTGIYKSNSGYPQLPINSLESAHVQVEKGKSILITNIITGYQKVQKSILSPFRQISAAFDKDCIMADNLFIIGYSFGDEHINMSIRTALKYNNKIKIFLIDPKYWGNEGYDQLVNKLINVFTPFVQNPDKQITDTCYRFFNEKVVVYPMGIKDFLEKVQ